MKRLWVFIDDAHESRGCLADLPVEAVAVDGIERAAVLAVGANVAGIRLEIAVETLVAFEDDRVERLEGLEANKGAVLGQATQQVLEDIRRVIRRRPGQPYRVRMSKKRKKRGIRRRNEGK